MKTSKIFFLLLLAIFAYSCEDILEEDITNDNIAILYPLNNAQIESNVVNFQWQELDGADDYRIQVYSTNQSIVLDSLVSTNHFTCPLNPGTYQWRVRGENFAYQTAYTFPVSFTLTATSDLTNQQVILSYPNPGLYTKNTSLTFSWTTISAAEFYVYQLINVTEGNILVHEEPNLNSSSFTLPSGVITQDAQYQWKVKAVNSETETETQFAVRNFYVDTTVPNQSQNSLPTNNSTHTINQEIDFSWTTPSDTGVIMSPITYEIQIASDQGFTNVLQTETISISSYEYTFTQEGDYYWRVKSKDQAGNEGNYGSAFKLTIIE